MSTIGSNDLRLTRVGSASFLTLCAVVCASVGILRVGEVNAEELPGFDFANGAVGSEWQATHDVAPLEATDAGLRIRITGSDPYINGPARNYPPDTLLWMDITLTSDAGGSAQVFFYADHPQESQSVRFNVAAGGAQQVRVPMPSLGRGTRLRFDPPGQGGVCLVRSIRFEERRQFAAPDWPAPEVPELDASALGFSAGDLRLRHPPGEFSEFELLVAGQSFAVGHSRPMIGYLSGGGVQWLELGAGGGAGVQVSSGEDWIQVRLEQRDAEGAMWRVEQRFAEGGEGRIDVRSSVAVDRDREVVYAPAFSVLVGLGSFGTNKNQALFPGLEYLANEPSSSEADVRGEAAQRQVPDTVKLTLPMMAVHSEGRYLGLCWRPQPDLCAVFDSPDRFFGAEGHLMQLMWPGSDGINRESASLLPYAPLRLEAGRPWVVDAWLIGGRGADVTHAVQRYLAEEGWPAVPDPGMDAGEYFDLAARGWLDSKIREGALYRHAYWPGFGAQPAADAVLWMDWLSERVASGDLSGRLREAARQALAQVGPEQYIHSSVGHVRYPAVPLAYGEVVKGLEQARGVARQQLNGFEGPGVIRYRKASGKPDYGSTHWADEANGLAAPVVAGVLEAAAYAGDWELIERGLGHLRALGRYRHTVPRGAQTWEIPLHTPDILGSAYLVRAFVLGYELTGDREFLVQAEEWAWTGVPFVYLTPPTSGSVGLYNTIAVLGATSWQAPVWFGQPVQWCGLVYADSLNRLAVHAFEGPWRQLADGIAAGGVQHTWPRSDAERQGLLPDFFLLRPQRRDGPAINPATVLAPALRLFRERPVYGFRCLPEARVLIHAPGEIREVEVSGEGLSFTVEPWSSRPMFVLVHGAGGEATVEAGTRGSESVQADIERDGSSGALVIRIEGDTRIRVKNIERSTSE